MDHSRIKFLFFDSIGITKETFASLTDFNSVFNVTVLYVKEALYLPESPGG